jgi:2-polyprenyl-3-methyl-5-hydroxy-6-metoxy-1,4-benzoquinol methylase
MINDMKCIACGNSKLSKYSDNSYMNLPIYHCTNCGLYITGNSENKVKEKSYEIYKKEYWDKRGSEKSLESDFTDIDSQGKKRQWISQYAYCKPYFEGKKDLLEIGSGAGQTIFWFEESGFTVTGIEPDERNVSFINKKLRHGHCITGFADDLNIDGKFDIIWISHVFEHLVRPDLLLKKYKDNLQKNGILFIEVPNCENDKILNASINENPSTFHFSKNALLNLAQKSGYQVERCDFFRSPTKFEGGLNRLKKNITFIKNDLYPYYPKILTKNREGTDIRLILKK